VGGGEGRWIPPRKVSNYGGGLIHDMNTGLSCCTEESRLQHMRFGDTLIPWCLGENSRVQALTCKPQAARDCA
jgi:hypothetical protein